MESSPHNFGKICAKQKNMTKCHILNTIDVKYSLLNFYSVKSVKFFY